MLGRDLAVMKAVPQQADRFRTVIFADDVLMAGEGGDPLPSSGFIGLADQASQSLALEADNGLPVELPPGPVKLESRIITVDLDSGS
jgi:hypothetical protein